MKTYFRVLHSPEHIAAWNSEDYFSYHFSVPGEWLELFYKKKNRDPMAYSLDTSLGILTAQARKRFLEIAPSHEPSDLWSGPERKEVSQLDGVCAFEDAASVFTYTEGNRYGGIYVVTFEGYFVSLIPESGAGMKGVLVKRNGKGLIEDLDTFRKKQ